MSKVRAPRCSRCKSPVGKDYIYRDDIKMIFHPKCWKYHKRDIANKMLYSLRRKAIRNAFQGGTGSKK